MRSVECHAVVFDLDGVLTDTVAAHQHAWRALFSALHEDLGWAPASVAPPSSADYLRRIDGEPRTEVVKKILASRGVHLPEGEPGDHPAAMTVHGVANRKNQLFLRELRERGVPLQRGCPEILEWLDRQAIPVGVVSTSHHGDAVLRAAGIRSRIDVVVDGVVASLLDLADPPAPDTYVHAAAQMYADPGRTVVVVDTLSGAESARAGGFRVIGVGRGADRAVMMSAGADVVVDGLDEIFAQERASARRR